ncbi:hypothetical protein GCM10028808_73030 [Spirosoma migulaei]
MKTLVKVTCNSKKESKSYIEEHPIRTEIELVVPYDPKSDFHKLSGGTNLPLCTVNQAVADMFVLGDEYDIVITPSKKVVAE